MHTLKKSLALIFFLCPTFALPMDLVSTSSSSQDDSTESSSEKSPCPCPACMLRAVIICQKVTTAAQTIMAFNFHNSLGDGLLEHLFRNITSLMKLENEFKF